MYLRLENIRKAFDTKVAVDNLSLEVPRGAICGIIGPNGAGKTTTIRMVMNITAPDSGRILLDGHQVDGDFRNHVGYLPEERGLYKKMTCEQVITYMAELKAYPKAKIAPKVGPWLERMDLGQYRYRKVEELSKGMQQKLQFITTVLHEPDLLILDELFSGLDPLNTELIKDVILDLKRRGTTILFSTHVMEQAEKLCDHICMISHGRKVLDGSLGDVKSRFGKNAVQLEIDGDGAFVRSLPGVKDVTDFNRYLELTLADGTEPDAILRAVLGRVKVRRFAIVEPSLYDIFIDIAKVDPSEVHGPAKTGGSHA
ncbi:ABC transporter [candidate division GN15 bacterium]|uniref:ABC transporter n=1 Tax=candidate division GN15 bacterium TaxID=2072418 RepID=A0A855X1R2_9BACT|nr:MAG: ABC transporter [candidate division GN15 bacterium]